MRVTSMMKPVITCLAIVALVAACSDGDGGGGGTTTDAGVADAGADTGADNDAGPAEDSGPEDTGSTTAQDTANGPQDTGKPVSTSKHNSFGTALPLTMGAESTEETISPVGELDYFTFEGAKGDAVVIGVAAQTTAFDKNTIDTVITVFDSDEKQIAENDDPLPRNTNDSQVMMILPKDGTYYVVVTECWTWVANKGISASCAEPQDKPLADYKVFVGKFNASLAHVVEDAEKGNTHAEATKGGYGKPENGNGYFVTRIYGTFSDDKDVDWYSFTPPADIDTSKSQLTASFEAHPHGKDGNGATSATGWGALSMADAPTATIAKVDFAKKGSDIWSAVTGGKQYLLSVKHPGTSLGSNDFYFISHQVRGDNPLEKKDETNGDPKTAEALTESMTSGNLPGFFISGTIAEAGKDLDHYEITIPAGYETAKISTFCTAQRSGSGLRSMTIRLLKADGSEISGAKWVEDDTTDASIKDIPVNNEKTMILKIEAAEQAKDVSSNYYRCGTVLQK